MGTTVRHQRDHYSRVEFLRSVSALEAALDRADGDPVPVAEWRERLQELRVRLDARQARVAVVGPVKSGKSTLVNALVGMDLLPRGAGVLTAQVTEVRRGPHPGVTVDWLTPGEADAVFSRLLGLLGRPGSWCLTSPEHRTAAAAAISASSIPAASAVGSLLAGYGAAAPLLGTIEADLPVPADGLSRWVARDEVALFLRGLRVTTPSGRLPEGLVLLDCQGYDAWNPCHGAELLAALQRADALVYVVSSRVGFRDADQRLLEQLQGLGLLGLTRFVLNVDWGEVRRPEELQRVRDTVCSRIANLGGTPPVEFSALQALLERLVLVAPESLSGGERRLLDAWDADCSAGMAGGREAFDGFCAGLWSAAAEERDAVVLRRLRADLRRLLVSAAAVLRHSSRAGLQRVAWEDDAADQVLRWAQQRVAAAVETCRQNLLQGLQRDFAARRAPQRQVWQRSVAAALENLESRADPLGTALAELARSEPLRVNAVRNLALVVRGELARQAEALAVEMASRLAQAGLEPTAPPSRLTLSREITVTRRIPLFATVVSGILRGVEADPAPEARGFLARFSRFERHGKVAGAAQAAARALVTARLTRTWERYLDQVREECLLPHVEEAAADLYSHLAIWVLQQLRGDPGGWRDLIPKPRAS